MSGLINVGSSVNEVIADKPLTDDKQRLPETPVHKKMHGTNVVISK